MKRFNLAKYWRPCCLHSDDGETPAKKSKKEKKKKKKKDEESRDEADEEQMDASAAVVRNTSIDLFGRHLDSGTMGWGRGWVGRKC